MPVIHNGKEYLTPEEAKARMSLYIDAQAELLRKELAEIKESRPAYITKEQELILS